ncbi:MAG: hypothetical protein ACI90V_011123 [Bacillariaceae sp.]|jgi:hypothetical protein
MTDRGDNDLVCRKMGGRHDTVGLGVTIDEDILRSISSCMIKGVCNTVCKM